METIMIPCRVPWSISRSMSGVTLTHGESDVEPDCLVVFGGGRINGDGLVDMRRIELTFRMCYFARLSPHEDTEGIEAIGYRMEPAYEGRMGDYLKWRSHKWTMTGLCPDSGFYFAAKSAWLASLPAFFHTNFRHYVVDGRDGYVELIASGFKWREWLWSDGHREDAPSKVPPVASGEGVG